MPTQKYVSALCNFRSLMHCAIQPTSSIKVAQNTCLCTISKKLISNYLQQTNSIMPYTKPVPKSQSKISHPTSPPLFRYKEAVRNIVHGMESGNLNKHSRFKFRIIYHSILYSIFLAIRVWGSVRQPESFEFCVWDIAHQGFQALLLIPKMVHATQNIAQWGPNSKPQQIWSLYCHVMWHDFAESHHRKPQKYAKANMVPCCLDEPNCWNPRFEYTLYNIHV